MINLLYLLGGFISGVLLLALFVKKNYAITRSIIIRQPKSLVFDYIKLLKNQDNYSKWATMDPNMNKTYRGTDGTVGFVSAWESPNRNVGKGEQELTNVVQGERIESELRFFRPFKSISHTAMTSEIVSEQETKVTWTLKGNIPYPFNLFTWFMNFEKTISNDFDFGLERLKDLLENNTSGT